jgi:hypothetical protein
MTLLWFGRQTQVLKELAALMLKALQEQKLMPIMWDHCTNVSTFSETTLKISWQKK